LSALSFLTVVAGVFCLGIPVAFQGAMVLRRKIDIGKQIPSARPYGEQAGFCIFCILVAFFLVNYGAPLYLIRDSDAFNSMVYHNGFFIFPSLVAGAVSLLFSFVFGYLVLWCGSVGQGNSGEQANA
jgi:hypothetical protein